VSLAPGARFGDYEILKQLAAGGMAEIYLARVSKMTRFQKMVVVKRILPALAQNSEFVEMFLDEARIAATLEHPHIVQTYDVGVAEGSYYIAMEYLHGEDVRAIAKELERLKQKMPLAQALNIIISAADGLHYAHEKVGFDGQPLEIVHRDISPQNLFVTYQGGDQAARLRHRPRDQSPARDTHRDDSRQAALYEPRAVPFGAARSAQRHLQPRDPALRADAVAAALCRHE
jgi:serine/threonine protein kinase